MSDNNSTNNLMLERAKAAVLSRDYSLATRLYRTLLQSEPDNVDLLFALGDLYQKSGNDEKAIPIYKQLIEKNPKDVASMNFLGSIYRRIKQWNESIDILEKAVIVDESNTQTFYNLGFTYKLMGRNEDAIECFNTVVEENPNDVLAYNHIGSIYASEHEYEKAVAAYQRGLKIDPNHPILHLNIAHSYEKLGSDDLAANEYEAALRSKPGWLDAIDGYADLLLKRKETKEVSEMLLQAIRLNPQAASVHSKMGRVYSLLGDYIGAESEFNASLKIDPKDFRTLADLAETYFKNGKFIESMRTMKKGDELCADSDISFMRRYAELMMDAEKLNAAGHKIKLLWEKDSEDLETLNLLGQYYICKNETAKAEGCYQKIRSLDPSYLEYLLGSAKRYGQTGRYVKAEQEIKKFLQSEINSQKGLEIYAKVLEKQGRYEEALDEYQKLAALDLDNIEYRSSMERIALALEGGQEEYDFSSPDMMEQETMSESMDDLEMQMRSTDENSSYESGAIMPSFDFTDIDEQRMSQAEMINSKNRGYSFEGLTMEDHSMNSPFTHNVDEDIMASNAVDDFDNLVPEPEKEPQEDISMGYLNSLPSNGTGMGNGPVEGLMGDKFLEEDIVGGKKVPNRTLDVSDGWDDSDDELNAPEPSPTPRRSGNAPAFDGDQNYGPEAAGNGGSGNGGGFASSSAIAGDLAAPGEEVPAADAGAAVAMADESLDISDEMESIENEDDTSDDVTMEGSDDIFTPEEDASSEDFMEFSDEEMADDDEMQVDQISDGADVESDEMDNGYGMSFDDDEEDIFGGSKEDSDSQTEMVYEDEPEDEEQAFESEDLNDSMESREELVENVTETIPSDDSGDDSVIDDMEFESDAMDETLDENPEDDIQGEAQSIDVNVSVEEQDSDDGDFSLDDGNQIEDAEENPEETFPEPQPAETSEPAGEPENECMLSAELFIKLRELSEYLPFDKKQQFLESRENLQLEYLIKKLSGDAGLLETAHDIREKMNLADSEVFELDKEDARGILNYMKSYIASLPDHNIARSLEGEVESAIEKL